MGEKFVAIIGGGNFGLQALQWALKNHYKAIVFDSNSQALVRNHVHAILSPDRVWTRNDFSQAPSVMVIGDAVELSLPILREIHPDFVIPTIPVHFLATTFLSIAREKGVTYLPDVKEVTRLVNNLGAPLNISSKSSDGILTLSYAQEGELCPPQCAGPADFCPTFHRQKEKTVTRIVNDVTKGCSHAFLVESQQLTKGLGGIPGVVFFDVMDRFQKTLPAKFTVATTCNCHGVLHAFTRAP